jgi:POT family proton-dependent oligopeptide transporter
MSSTKTFFGHPRGLATLFFTEMWERFSYYGMRAILILFLRDSIENGGLGLDPKNSAAIYGLYTMFVYLLAMPGGWLADNFFGLRKSVFIGGCFIAAGHFFLVIPTTETFFIGLVSIVLGVGLLKPNISGIVGGLYSTQEQSKRDAGFSIFYMGINIGAFIGPLIAGFIGERIAWNLGFGVAGIGMVLGLIQYKLTEKYLGDIGVEPARLPDAQAQANRDSIIKKVLVGFGVALISVLVLGLTQTITINPFIIANASGYIIAGAVILYFFYIFTFGDLTPDEKKKVSVIGILFIFSALFWSGFEQAGSSLNIFALDYTDRNFLGWEIPASWMQSVNAIFIIALSPMFAWLWVWLANRKLDPNTPTKFSFGLLLLAIGFALVAIASYYITDGNKPLFWWLIFTYLLHTMGELCLSPVGLSLVTKLSPKKLVGQMMGVWFMSVALGNLIAGLVAGGIDDTEIKADPSILPNLFWFVVMTTGIGGFILLMFNKSIRKLMGDIN